MPLIPPDLFRRGKERKMPHGLKDEDFDKIQNEIVRKLYEISSLDRLAFLVECTEQELREAMTELRKIPKSKGKIEAIERELRNRGNKNKKTKFFPSDLAEKRFAREWTKVCRRIRGGGIDELKRARKEWFYGLEENFT